MTRNQLRTLTGAILCATLAPLAQADTIFGVYVGANQWANDVSGHINTNGAGDSDIDAKDGLNLDADKGDTVYIAVEHPIPLIPNVRFAFTNLRFTGDETLNKEITFNGTTYAAATNIESEIDISHNDVTLYYELLDNVVSLDVGVNVRIFDGSVALSSAGTGRESISLDQAVPMLYASARADLPLTGLYVGGDAYFLSIGSNEMSDLTAKVGYTITHGFGVEGGYRVLRLKLDDVNNLNSDVKIDGAYASATFHF